MPKIAFGKSAWLPDLFDRLEKRVAEVTGFPHDRVFTYLGDPLDLLDNPPTEQFISLGLDGADCEQDLLAGSGAIHSGFSGTFTPCLFTRIGTDRAWTDPQLLRDKQHGFADHLKALCVAVQGYPFIEPDGTTSKFREPTRVLSFKLNPRRPATGWAWVAVRTNVRFVADLSGGGG